MNFAFQRTGEENVALTELVSWADGKPERHAAPCGAVGWHGRCYVGLVLRCQFYGGAIFHETITQANLRNLLQIYG